MRLSIIIPCYNLESYIGRCLDTVLDQDISEEEYEVILINDGSTDRTAEIIAKYAEEHINIRIITQTNRGVSSARNAGIKISQGKYIWFVDGDDWVTPCSLGNLLHLAESRDVDILRFDCVHLSKYQTPKSLKEQGKREVVAYSIPDFFQKKVKRKFFLFCQLLKREIIIENNISFLPLQMCEDVPFLAQYITLSKKIVAVKWDIYYYFNRQDSAANTIRPKRSKDTFAAYEQLRDIVFPYMYDKRFARYMKRLIMIRIMNEFDMYLKNGTHEEQRMLLESYKKSNLEDFSMVYINISFRKVLYAVVLKLHSDTFFLILGKPRRRNHKTLIVRYSQIGDVLIVLPVIYSLAKKYPNEEFVMLTNHKFNGIFEQLPLNVCLLPMIYRKKKGPLRGLNYIFNRYFMLLKIFFSSRYDKVALLQNGTFENQLKNLLSLKKSKVALIDLKEFLTPEKLQRRDYFNTPSLNDLYIKTLDKLGYKNIESRFDASYYHNKKRQKSLLSANTISFGKKLIGIAPFSRIPTKMYPLEKMEEIIACFHSRPDVQLLIFGGGEDEKAKAELWKETYPGISSLIGRLSFNEELIVIASCYLMVSMDSANLHMAALVGTPVVSIWGPSHPGMGYYPYNEPHEYVVQRELHCRPCSFWGEKPCKNPQLYQCMDIDPEVIVQKMECLLAEN